jgi:hypothetical protein
LCPSTERTLDSCPLEGGGFPFAGRCHQPSAACVRRTGCGSPTSAPSIPTATVRCNEGCLAPRPRRGARGKGAPVRAEAACRGGGRARRNPPTPRESRVSAKRVAAHARASSPSARCAKEKSPMSVTPEDELRRLLDRDQEIADELWGIRTTGDLWRREALLRERLQIAVRLRELDNGSLSTDRATAPERRR